MRRAPYVPVLLVLCALAAVPGACDSGGSPPPPKPLPGEWQPLGLGGETVGDIPSIAVHPGDPDVLYAGAWGGLFKTTDGGETWDTLRTEGIYVNVQISPQASEVVYAAGSGEIIKSTDGGQTWENISEGLLVATQTWNSMALDPRTPDVVYAGMTSTHGNDCPQKTLDGGESWEKLDGPTGFCDGVTSLAVDPETPEVVYVGTGGFGIFKSTDGGSTWSRARSGYVPFIRISPASRTVYANIDGALHRSEDGGETWKIEAVADSVGGPTQMVFRPQENERYLATQEGVYLSRADSAWVEGSTGLPHRWVKALAIGPGSQRLYAGLKRIHGEEHGLYVRELTGAQPDQ